jgi:hypothetical protein
MQLDQQGPGKRFHVWQVAAAILSLKDELHIDVLTQMILDSGLTTLGLKGGTPRQTVCPVLLKRNDVFVQNGNGYYKIRNSDSINNLGVFCAAGWLKAKYRCF